MKNEARKHDENAENKDEISCNKDEISVKIKVKFYVTFKMKFHAAIKGISRCDQSKISEHDLMWKKGYFFIF